MARTPAPAGLKLLQGRSEGRGSGGRPVPLSAKFVREAPEPPARLSGEGLAEWHGVVPGLERLDLLKVEDQAVLATYCETYARFVDAVRLYRVAGDRICRRSRPTQHTTAVSCGTLVSSRFVSVDSCAGSPRPVFAVACLTAVRASPRTYVVGRRR